MPQDHRSSKAAFPLADAQRLKAEGHSYKAVAHLIGWSFGQTRRYLQGQYAHNGDRPAIPAHHSALDRISAPERIDSALELDEIRDRLATLEAFMSAIQSTHHSALPAHPNAPAHRSAPQRTELPVWISRGTDIAQDMRDAIDAYAAQHRLEKREVLDLALRRFFAEVGGSADA